MFSEFTLFAWNVCIFPDYTITLLQLKQIDLESHPCPLSLYHIQLRVTPQPPSLCVQVFSPVLYVLFNRPFAIPFPNKCQNNSQVITQQKSRSPDSSRFIPNHRKPPTHCSVSLCLSSYHAEPRGEKLVLQGGTGPDRHRGPQPKRR